ncbi:OsmC family protein [Companilactobacillus sp.]|uniref:OsmC family protein n=1 Tax=Companilactobacillus sp. TaxID=2767905 RepID=UPI00261E00D0|nr:OsmC family protein [Companilactobacillus sp.]
MLKTFKATAKQLPGGLEVETASHGYKVKLVEPTIMGGTDEGINPLEALMCALGACESIVAASFCKKFGFKYDDFYVELEGDIDTKGFMGDPDVRNGLQEIRFTMHFKTDESQEKAEEFADFIQKTCPVVDNLSNGVKLVRTGVIRE